MRSRACPRPRGSGQPPPDRSLDPQDRRLYRLRPHTLTKLDGAAPYWTSYTYTDVGQRKTETQHTTTGDKTTTYTYNDTADNKPHTLDKTTGTRTATYTYDAAGNTTSRPGPTAQQTLTWNTEGDLTKLTEGTKETGYLYDANGDLLIRRAKGDGETILYLGAGTELHVTTKGTTKTTSATRYYTANGQTIAVRTATTGVTGTKLSFLAADHHGTSSIALQAGTYALTKRYSTPFGAPRGTKPTTWPDDKAFLGKPTDDTTNLTHISAREYDPTTGQFISVDPLLTLDQHQSLNGYAYANNAPATFSDPSGLIRLEPDGTQYSGGWQKCGPKTGGTGSTTSTVQEKRVDKAKKTSKGSVKDPDDSPKYVCKYSGPGQQCLPVDGPEDSQRCTSNFLSSLVKSSHFWSGLADALGGVVIGTLGGGALSTGVTVCGTGVLCPVGTPVAALGAGMLAVATPMLKSGSGKLATAFREADSAGSSTGSSSANLFDDPKDWQHVVDRHRQGGKYVDEGSGLFTGRAKDVRRRITEMVERGTGRPNTPDPKTREPRTGTVYEYDFGDKIGTLSPKGGGYPASGIRVIVNEGGTLRTAHPINRMC
ncbi:RHS repeat-associated core domain-containing protein [Streptomyces achromogenes]|uniref:RHS repeat-associated core domain-containing protein n=1 Tax=Streptomyces achromogenes TaxID=67255 RepID=UPI0036791EC1